MKRNGTALLLSLAISTPAVAQSAAPATLRELTTLKGLQVGIGPCVTRSPRGVAGEEDRALFAAIGTALVTKGISALGSAIGKLGDEKTWSQTAKRNFETAQGSKFPQCVQVARGTFATNTNRPAAWTLPGWPDGAAARLAQNGLVLTAAPEFLFEGEFVASTLDPGVMTLRPSKVSFVQPIGTKAVRGTARSIALFVALSKPGDKPDLSTNPGATILFGEMETGTTRTFAPADQEFAGVGTISESAWFSIAKDKKDPSTPLTISVLETETLGADKFLKFIGSVLSDKPVTDELTKIVTPIVVPGAAATAQFEAELADLKASADASKKQWDALNKLEACIADPKGQGAAARDALNLFFEADGKLEKPSNVIAASMIKALDPSKPEATIRGACVAAQKALL